MSYVYDKNKVELINKVISEIELKLPKEKAKNISNFVSKFYGTVAYDDLEQHTVADLYGVSISFWSYMSERKEGETKVRVYNPEFETNAWQSTHTIIEITSEDMPFLVDSTVMELNRQEITCHFIMHTGGIRVVRDKDHQIKAVLDQNDKHFRGENDEAAVYLEIDRQTDPTILKALEQQLQNVLKDVRVAVEDWQAMREAVKDALVHLEENGKSLDPEEFAESKDFLRWIIDNHFTFLGIRDYELRQEGGEQVLKIIQNTGLGVLRDTSDSQSSRRLVDMTPEARRLTLSHQILIVSKTNTVSTVHRPVYTDYIGVKRFDTDGHVVGERRIIGLYTSAAYNTNPKQIPFLRRKVAAVLDQTGFGTRSHAGKVLVNILETLPRDDLFQATIPELLEMSLGIFYLQERRRIRLFARKDVYGRFMSCLVYVPRDRFNTELREAMQTILENEFAGTETTFTTRFSDSVLARIHFIVRLDPHLAIEYDLKDIERKLIDIARLWEDDLCDNLREFYGEEQGNSLIHTYAHAFPSSYRESFLPRTALYDIKRIENLSNERTLELNFYKPVDEMSGTMRFKLYTYGRTIPLSDALPILEGMGLRVMSEEPYEIKLANGSRIWISDFGMSPVRDFHVDIDQLKETFQELFSRVWFGHAENDGFNALVLSAGLNWRQITLIRTYAKYFRQTGFTFSQSYIEHTLVSHADIAKGLVQLFELRFDPTTAALNETKIRELEQELKTKMDSVSSLDEDRILRRYLILIMASLRTNFFQQETDGQAKPYLSIKLSSHLIPDLPLPRPMFEIFVYSPRFEGVHLRGAKVARGGLRWSDRREDFRTEILGLMKAQQVKNAVIVPSGAKGGFVPKYLPEEGSREEIMEEGIKCYRNFIRGLLDITDNLNGNEVVPPENVYRYDGDDTYLVVAADKGTATFSDIANSISEQYGFWLGDAFASGGSTGYDHKKMGITARGAWESVKRHFRELGVDIQTTDFTCIGIGDLAGDVFGNGMLLSRHTKLVAAFNHVHIFLDPDPSPEISFEERQRMFNLPRSAWTDYDPKCLSKGGGIYSRKDKSIPLSPEVQKMLNVDVSSMVPNDLIHAILKAPVDLLWNGGIGTFVKGRHETHADVGDRSNDAIRINSDDLRVRVVGEGGNLGFTQLARVEYSLNGGLIFTDFIDNSGGVDCSDHEVNIKILLNGVVANGDLTVKQRNVLLAEMTEEVAALVLRHNYRQTQAISLAAVQAVRNIELHSRYMKELEQQGSLNRSLEFLPDEKALNERKSMGKGLTRPGIAILLAYSKITLKEQILKSDVPEDPYLANMLRQAFPKPLREKYSEQMYNHSLHREIIATQVANNLVNQMGFTFVYRLFDETGASAAAIVRAYTIAINIFSIDKLWSELEALDNSLPTQKQFSLMLQLIRLIRRATRWLLKNRRMNLDIALAIDEFTPLIKNLINHLEHSLLGDDLAIFMQSVKEYRGLGLTEESSRYFASSRALLTALDVAEAANQNDFSVEDVANIYYAIDERLDLGWIRAQIIAHPVDNHWEALSREALRDDLDWQQRQLTIAILKQNDKSSDPEVRIEIWSTIYKVLIDRWQGMLSELRGSSVMNFTMYFVAIRELLDLTQTSMQGIENKRQQKSK